MTTTTLGHEKEVMKASIADRKGADKVTKEDQIRLTATADKGSAAAAPAGVPGYQPEPLSNARFLLGLTMSVASSLYLLARSFDDWLSGPPMTAQERERLSVTASDRHRKYWSRL